MIIVLTAIISWLSSTVGSIIALELPFANGTYISLGKIILFMFYTRIAWYVIKLFLEKGQFNLSHGKDGKDS